MENREPCFWWVIGGDHLPRAIHWALWVRRAWLGGCSFGCARAYPVGKEEGPTLAQAETRTSGSF